MSTEAQPLPTREAGPPPPPHWTPAWMLGVGSDLVEVDRIRQAADRHGERFLARVFTAAERAYCGSLAHPWPHYAARFAAKEAISKAFGTGIGAELKWTSMGVVHHPRGAPLVELDERGQALLARVGGTEVRLTLSHTTTHALAVAVIVAAAPPA